MKDFGFFIGQKVYIPEASLYARIQSIMLDSDGIQYRVVFWDGSIRKTEWVFKNEIVASEKERVQ